MALVDPNRLLPTWRYHAILWLRRIARPAVWVRLLRGRYGLLNTLKRRLDRQPEDGADAGGRSVLPDHEKRLAEEALAGLVARQVQILLVVTGSESHRYNYREQFVDAFPGLGLSAITRAEILHDAEHIFPREADRIGLENLFVEWAVEGPFAEQHAPGGPDASSVPVPSPP
jgi:hypothetical protein